MVSTWPTSRWLAEQIASVNGICAQVNFPFPTSHLRKFVQLTLGLEQNAEDQWKKSKLKWTIINSFPELFENKESSYLVNWLEKEILNTKDLTKRKWELANEIATIFNQYILYRPELICNWWESSNKNNDSIENLPAHIRWQPILLGLLKQKIEQEPLPIQINKIKNRLRNNIVPKSILPKELFIFGISSLPAIHIEFLQSLSSIVDIKVFLLTPCKDLWKRCRNRREELGQEWNDTLDDLWLLNAPRIEANLGRMGAEFQQLLEGSGEYQLGEWEEKDLFAMPAKIAANSARGPTLLEQLQESLITSDSNKKLTRQSNDNSIIFLSAPGKKRQIQIIRDQIIQWLAEDDSLEPRDILIMTPQIETYAPLITSVFNDISATTVNLPWKITDRSQHDKPGLIKFMIELMDISSGRLTALKLDSLLSNKLIQNQFELTQEDADTITNCLQRTGFRWGLDCKDKNGDEAHSLSWCLERWALGIILPSRAGLAPKGISPYSENCSLQQINKWTKLLLKLISCITDFKSKRNCHEWVLLIKENISALFQNEGPWTWEIELLNKYLDEWQNNAENCDLKIEISIVSEILKESLALESGRFGHRSGKITISALEPMRAIPHRVIILMGLDHSVFPRNENKSSFNLMNNKRLLGDPKSTDRDRYVLLESLMSCRQKLLIAWNSRNERTGETIESPGVIHQWIEFLKSELKEEEIVGLLRKPPANPLSNENFREFKNLPPISCDKRNLNAKKWINAYSQKKSFALAMPLSWDVNFTRSENKLTCERTKFWLKAPQIYWLDQMQVRVTETKANIEDLESLQLSELQRFNLLTIKYLENKEFLKHPDKLIKKTNWQKQLKGQGILPSKAAGNIECEILDSRWESLSSLLVDIGGLENTKLEIESERIDMLTNSEVTVSVEIGKLKPHSIMNTWLLHLQTCAYSNCQRKTILVSRSTSYTKQDQYEISIKFGPIPKENALLILDKINLMVEQGNIHCWPIPPESGWEIAKAIFVKKTLGHEAFKRKWLGSFGRDGENIKPEMRLCFGDNCGVNIFLESEIFKNCLNELYKPLFSNLAMK